jgi:hypothetical protein
LDINATTRSKTKASSSVAPQVDARNPPSVQSVSAEPKILTAEPKKPPAFTYKSKAAMPEVVQRVFQGILETTIPHIMVADLLAISPELRKEAVKHCHTHRVPTTVSSTNILTPDNAQPLLVELATPLREIPVMINGVHPELGLLDEGSEIIVIQEDIWKKTKAPINKEARMRMQTANGGSQEMAGCVEMLEIEVEGIKAWAHTYVVSDAVMHGMHSIP